MKGPARQGKPSLGCRLTLASDEKRRNLLLLAKQLQEEKESEHRQAGYRSKQEDEALTAAAEAALAEVKRLEGGPDNGRPAATGDGIDDDATISTHDSTLRLYRVYIMEIMIVGLKNVTMVGKSRPLAKLECGKWKSQKKVFNTFLCFCRIRLVFCMSKFGTLWAGWKLYRGNGWIGKGPTHYTITSQYLAQLLVSFGRAFFTLFYFTFTVLCFTFL